MSKALIVDGSNIFAASKQLGYTIDYAKLRRAFPDVYRAMYFTALHEEDDGNRALQPLVDYLSYNGWFVVTKMTKTYQDIETLQVKTKGNMDVEITLHTLAIAEHVEEIVLFSGDGDFRALVEHVQVKYGRKVTVVSTMQPKPMIADVLRRQADVFMDMADPAVRTMIAHEEERVERSSSRFSFARR